MHVSFQAHLRNRIRALTRARHPVIAAGVFAACLTILLLPYPAAAGPLELLTGALSAPFSAIGLLFHWFTSLALWLAGLALNWVTIALVIQMGVTLTEPGTTDLIAGIDTAWVVLRDLANLLFIFGLLVIGIGTILGLQNYSAKRLLARLIIAALLVNFSLFFAKAIIDVSNLFATQTYYLLSNDPSCVDAIRNTRLAGSTFDAAFGADTAEGMRACLAHGISGRFMAYSGTQSATTDDGEGMEGFFESLGTTVVAITDIQTFITFSFAGVLNIILAFVFFAAALMLIIRFVLLTILMILSPIAFAGFALPWTEGYATRWWKALMSNALFAPVFFLMLFVAASIFDSMKTMLVGEEGSFLALFASEEPNAYYISIAIMYILTVIGVITALVTAKNMGAWGANWATAVAGSMTGALTVGLAARGYRNTVGARAYRASESDDLKKRAAQSGVRGMMARAQLRTSRAAANATGDFRNTAIPGADRLGKGTRRSYANLAAEQKREGQAMSKYLGSPTKEEKAKIANVKKQQDTELEQMREQVDQQRKQVKELKEDAQDAGRNPAEQPGYNSARDALRRMEKDLEATEKRLKTELKSYETPLRARQESYASTYEQLNPYGLREFFRPADKDTAEAIRSELQKDKNQKLIDSIKDVSNENSK